MASRESSAGLFFREYRQLIFLSLFTFLALLFFIPPHHFVFDLKCWENWCLLIYEHGLVAAYDPDISKIDYMPLYLYVLKVYTWLAGDRDAILEYINYLKAFTLFFEVLSIALLAGLIQNKEKRLLCFMIGILNIGFLYNNLFWQQVDGILAFLLLASFLFAIRNKTTWSFIFFILAFNFKTQAIVLLPLLGILWMNGLTLKKALSYIGIAIAIQVIIMLPFLINGNAKTIGAIALGSYDHYEKASVSAQNIWFLVLRDYPPFISDKTTWLGISYHHYGLFLYILSIALIVSPLIYLLARNHWRFPAALSTKFLVLSAALLPYVFFYFNTQMHERYIHCSIIFLTMLAFQYRHWGVYILVTLNYFLCLEYLLGVNRVLKGYHFLFDMKHNAIAYGIGLVWLFVLWFREWKSVLLAFIPQTIKTPSTDS